MQSDMETQLLARRAEPAAATLPENDRLNNGCTQERGEHGTMYTKCSSACDIQLPLHVRSFSWL